MEGLFIEKLQITNYKKRFILDNVKKYNFNIGEELNGNEDKEIDCLFVYIDKMEEVRGFIEKIISVNLSKNHRIVIVYEKNKENDVNRKNIAEVFQTYYYRKFKLQKPMFCSLSVELNAFVLSYIG